MLRGNGAYSRTYETHALEEALMKRDATAATARHTLLRAYAFFLKKEMTYATHAFKEGRVCCVSI